MLEYLSCSVNTGSSVLRSQHGNRIVGPADMVRGKPPAQPQPHGAAYRVLSPCLCRRPMHVLSTRVPRNAGGSSSQGNYRCVFEMEPLEDKLRPCMRARNLSGICISAFGGMLVLVCARREPRDNRHMYPVYPRKPGWACRLLCAKSSCHCWCRDLIVRKRPCQNSVRVRMCVFMILLPTPAVVQLRVGLVWRFAALSREKIPLFQDHIL